jgi:hypothetical protein
VLDGREVAGVDRVAASVGVEAVRVAGRAVRFRRRAALDCGKEIIVGLKGRRCRRRGARDEREDARDGSEAVLVDEVECASTRGRRLSFRGRFASTTLQSAYASAECIHRLMPEKGSGLERADGSGRSAPIRGRCGLAVSGFGVAAERGALGLRAFDAVPSGGRDSVMEVVVLIEHGSRQFALEFTPDVVRVFDRFQQPALPCNSGRSARIHGKVSCLGYMGFFQGPPRVLPGRPPSRKSSEGRGLIPPASSASKPAKRNRSAIVSTFPLRVIIHCRLRLLGSKRALRQWRKHALILTGRLRGPDVHAPFRNQCLNPWCHCLDGTHSLGTGKRLETTHGRHIELAVVRSELIYCGPGVTK